MAYFHDNADLFAAHTVLRATIGLNPVMQDHAQRLIQQATAQARSRNADQGAMVVMGADGLVHALVGGPRFAANQYDHATMARRQPGSAFKPFVYLAALQSGMKPTDRILDAPLANGWPRNFDRKYQGKVELQYALAQSLNGATAHLAQLIGYDRIIALARQLGLRAAQCRSVHGPGRE